MDPQARRWRRTAVAIVLATFVLVAGVARGALPPLFALVVAALALAVSAWVAAPGRGLPRLRPPKDMTTRYMQATAFFAATPSMKLAKGLNLSDLAFALVVAGLILRRRKPRPDAPNIAPFLVGALLLAAGGLFGTMFEPATNPFPGLGAVYYGSALGPIGIRYGDLVRFVIVTVGMLVAVRFWRPDLRDRWAVGAAFGAGAVTSVLYAVSQGTQPGGRAQGLTTHPVFYGTISALAVVVGIGLAASSTGRRRLYGIVVAVVCAYGVLGSGTRGAVLMVAAGVAFFLIAMRSARVMAAFVGVGLVGLLATVLLPGMFGGTETVVRLQGGGNALLSNQGRDLLREQTYALIRTNGLTGAGFRYLAPPHSFLLGILVTAGIAGLIGTIVIVAALVFQHLSIRDRDPMAVAAIAAVLGLFTTSWVVNFGWDRWLWVLIAVFATVRAHHRSHADDGADDGDREAHSHAVR
ncbi:MAG: O-antigen ligase family protein [Acidimicrobiia bacterium]|nr:O-antigen ligase family protein [Acidimicrobiia bacterium]